MKSKLDVQTVFDLKIYINNKDFQNLLTHHKFKEDVS